MTSIINKPLEICLKSVGIWPYSYHFVGPFLLISILVTLLPFQCWDAFFLIDNPMLLMDSLSDIFTEILIFMKLITMWLNKRKIEDLIRVMIRSWKKDVIPEQWKILAYYCKLFCIIDMSSYFIAAVPYYYDMMTNYFGESTNRNLIFKSRYPFNYTNSPINEIINVLQILQGGLMGWVDSLSKSFLVTCVLHVAAQIVSLEKQVEKYSIMCKDDAYKTSIKLENFKLITNEHLNIIMFVKKINDAYGYVSLFQIVFGGLIICVTGFVIITAVESANVIVLVKFIIFIIVMLGQSFTFCFVGQYLQNKGETLTETMYNCFWYNTQPHEMKMIMFVILNTQKPLILNGGNLFEVTLKTFVKIIKTSFSYLSVLRAMYS